ncbi:MAG: GNAT family N-acetyltransferase [Maricaulaceae bacterium]
MSASDVSIGVEDPRAPDGVAMIAALDERMRVLYGEVEEERHALQPGRLAELDAFFLTARCDGEAVGCGALIPLGDGQVEIKRMWTDPAARRGGVARAVLAALLAEARRRGAVVAVLETGVRQPEAIALYRSEGFVVSEPFADYEDHPDSVFMKKRLVSVEESAA